MLKQLLKKIPKIITEKNENNFRKRLDNFKDNESSENRSYNREIFYTNLLKQNKVYSNWKMKMVNFLNIKQEKYKNLQ